MPSRLDRRDVMLALGAGMLAGCGTTPRKTIAQVRQLYSLESQLVRDRLRSLVAIPGILGSALRTPSGEAVWGRWRFDLLKAGQRIGDMELARIALPMAPGVPLASLRDDLEPAGILHYVALDFPTGPLWVAAYAGAFAGLMREVVDLGDRRPLILSHAEFGDPPFVGFGYDWRRDVSEQAALLGKAVEEASMRRGGPVTVVAHSMGGLVLRYYLRFGERPLPEDGSVPEVTWEGARRVSHAILAGPPNAGSVAALKALVEGELVDSLLPLYPSAVLATMPTSAQLLPRVRHRLVRWKDSGEPVPIDDVELWRQLRWGPFAASAGADLAALLPAVESPAAREDIVAEHMAKCFARARQLHAALDQPATPPPGLRSYFMVGDSLPTPAVYTVDRASGRLELAEEWPGDGTVTRASALFDERMGGGTSHPFDSPFEPTAVRFLDFPHQRMLDSPTLLDELLFLTLT